MTDPAAERQDELTTLLTAGGVESNVQLTGIVMPKATMSKEKSPSVNVAVPAWSGVQVPDSVTVIVVPFGTAPCEPAVTVTGFSAVPVVAIAWVKLFASVRS